LAERKISLRLTEAAKRILARKGYDPVYGARPLKRAIQQSIENPLAMEILKGRFPEGAEVLADAEGDRITFSRD
jgi:ATP-dependent Clp protease ATP-binding subunit ClpB